MTGKQLDDLMKDLAGDLEEAPVEPLDPRLDDLVEGTLSADDLAALQEMADHDPETRRALEAMTPLGDAFTEQVTDEILKTLGATDAPATSTPVANVGPTLWERLREFFSLPLMMAAPALALGAFLVVSVPGGITPGALPLYTLEMSTQDKTLRSGEDAPSQGVADFSSGSLLEVVLRPAEGTAEALEVQSFLLGPSGLQVAPLSRRVSASGAVKLTATVGEDLVAAPGVYELLVVVAPEGAAPTREALEASLQAPDDPQPWQLLRRTISLVGGGAP
jgi:hypothetical protein